ncbi:hypothetical protein T440DRAFT_358557, partial [Plenodomus tracheiphilus IPT5]
MHTKFEMLQEYFGVKTFQEAGQLYDNDYDKGEPTGSNWTSLRLPYRAPDCADLPSMNEIRSAIETNQVTFGYNKYRVCTLGRSVVKWGSQVVIQGAEDLLYIKANSQARVPTVYAAFIEEDMYRGRPCSVHYVVMERIDGVNLTCLWDKVSDEARSIISSRMFEQIHHPRAMPSLGYYGRVHNLPLDPRSPLVCVRQDERCGPYESYAESYPGFYNGLVRQTKSEEGAEDWEVTYIDF